MRERFVRQRAQELSRGTRLRSRSDVLDRVSKPDLKIGTGFPKIDTKMRGFRPGEFTVIAGAPHQGKTAFAVNVVAYNCDLPILFVTPDEKDTKLWLQLGAIFTGNTVEDLEEDEGAMRAAVKRAMEECPRLEVVDEALEAREIGEAVDDFVDEHGEEPALIFYDYLQKVKLGQRDNGDWNARADALKNFAKRSGIHVVALSQPKKEYYDSIPDLSGLSGGGEQQAISLLWTERRSQMVDTYEDDDITWDDDRCPALHVCLLKSKNGKTIDPGKAVHLGFTPDGKLHPYAEALNLVKEEWE